MSNYAPLKDKIQDKKLTGTCGIGHTRWATHGKVTLNNTHPHFSQNERFFIVHN